MRHIARRSGTAVGVLTLSACAHFTPGKEPPRLEATPLPPIAAVHKGEAGGVYAAETPWTLVSDTRAFRPGDALTVTLEEVTQASKSADTNYEKTNTVAVTPLSVAGQALKSNITLSADRTFAGTGSSTQQNALTGSITVVVQDVLPNGMLRISGEKSLRLNQGEEFIRVVGYVRSADIDTDNRVSSSRIANAGITYSGRGVLNDANQPGWLAKFFTGPFMPF
jgi:flagellar L-ring protein precursor FlgH